MSIRSKIMGCFILVLSLFLGVSIYSFQRSREATERLALVNELFLPLSRQVAQLQTNVQGLVDDIRRFYFRPEAGSEASTFSTMVRDLYPYLIHKKFVIAERILSSPKSQELKSKTQELSNMLSKARTTFEQLTTSTHKESFETHYATLRTQLQALSKRLDEECQNVTMAAQREGRDNLMLSLMLAVFLSFSGLLTLMFTHRVLNPLPQLVASLRRIADGDFHQSLKVKAAEKDEVSLLAREYNRMLSALSDRDQKIQKQQKDLLDSERLAAVGQLSAEVVHEIRNPLNAISLNIDWLGHELKSVEPEIAKTIQSVSTEVGRLHQITESYLARARVPLAESRATPVNELVKEILDFSRAEAKASAIEFEISLHPDEFYVHADRSRLKQAFINVLKNAKEAMPKGGTLRIITEVNNNFSRVHFSDSGLGMSETTKRKTFDPFFTTKENGTGLGLSVTKTIVEEANGSLEFESRLGEGSTFTFQFPIAA